MKVSHRRRRVLCGVVVFAALSSSLALGKTTDIHDWKGVEQLHPGQKVMVVTGTGENACTVEEVTEEHIRCERRSSGAPIEYTVARADVLSVWKGSGPPSPLVPVGIGAATGAAVGAGAGVAYSGSASGTVVGRTAALGAIVGAAVGYGVSNHRSHEPTRKVIYVKS